MKKLLFLLAGLAIMTACNQTKPDPNPGPTPGGDPMINRTEATISTLDSVHIFIANAPGKYEWTTTDTYMLKATNEEMTEFMAFAFGEVTLSTEIDGKTYSCKVTINKVIEDKAQYDMPVVTWGATKEAVMAEAVKTSKFLDEVTENGVTYVIYEQNAPTVASKGQINEYAFQNDILVQTRMMALYENEEQSAVAWLYTLERCFFLGPDKGDENMLHGIDRATQKIYHIFGQTIMKEGNTPAFESFMLQPKESQSIVSKSDATEILISPMAKKSQTKQIPGPLKSVRAL